MNARTETDLRALLPALLADAERLGQTRQQITERVVRLIDKCEEINNRAASPDTGEGEDEQGAKP